MRRSTSSVTSSAVSSARSSVLLAMLGGVVLSACAAPDLDDHVEDPGGGPGDPGNGGPDEPTETITFPDQDPTGDDPAHAAVLPGCASPLAQAMFAGARDVVWRGTVPGDRFATSHSTADTEAMIDGPEIFPKFRELIASARHNVALQTFVWEVDTDPTREILAGLTDLARKRAAEAPDAPPVEVRFLLDASTIGIVSEVVTLPRLWASVQALQLDPAHVTFELGAFAHVGMGVLHTKTLVVDGRDAIITGANPQAHHNYARPWRDSGYRFTGDVAISLLADFDSAWRKGERWTCGHDERPLHECVAPNARPSYVVRRPALPAETCRPMLVTTRQSDMNPTSNRIDNTQDQAFLAGWAAAQRHIRIQTPNLNDDAAKAALVAAIERGVRVEIVLSRGFNDLTEDLPGQGGNNDTNVRQLHEAIAAAGVTDPCDRLQIRWHSRTGATPVYGNGPYASHAKYSSIDDEVVIVGTANQDTQSWNNSREVNIVVDDPALTAAWDEQLFLADFAKGIPVEQCD